MTVAAPTRNFQADVDWLRKDGYKESDIYEWATTNRDSLHQKGYDPNAIDTYIGDYDKLVRDKQLKASKEIDPAALLERAFTLIPRQDYHRMLEAGVLTDRDFDRLIYSLAYGLTPTQTDLNYDQLVELHGGFRPSSVNPVQRGFWSKIAESARRGWSDIATDVAIANAYMEGKEADLDTLLANRRKLRMRQVIDPIDGNIGAKMFYGGANVVGGWSRSMFESMDEATIFALTGAGAAATVGQLGPQVGLPEEIVTVPSATAMGATYGMVVGSTDFWWRQCFGSLIAESIDAKYDMNVAAPIAAIASIPYALIELSQMGAVVPNLKHAARGSFRRVILNAIKHHGKVWGHEVGEEVLQEVIQITAQDVSAALSHETDIFIDPDYLAARGWRLWNTARESAISMALLPLPGTAVNVTTGAIESLGKEPLLGELFPPEEEAREPRPEGAPPYEAEGQAAAAEPGEKPFTPKTQPALDAAIEDIDAALGMEPAEEAEPITETDVTPLPESDLDTLQALEESAEEEEAPAEPPPEEAKAPGRTDMGNLIKPKLHIGNVTARMRKVFAEQWDVEPEEIHGFKEGGFRTKRRGIPMIVQEGYDLLEKLEERLDEYVAQSEWTMDDVTQMNILWGDIVSLRKELDLPKGQRPYKQKHQKGQLVVTIENVGRRIYESIRGLGKKTLAEYSYQDLISEEEAIRGSMKKAAQAARKAFSVGKKEGIAKIREHYRELRRKQRALRLVKRYRERLVRQILRDVPANVDFFYKQGIAEIQAQVEPRTRSAKTQQRLEALRRALKRNPELAETIPTKLLTKLARTPLQEITTLELETLADERKRLEKLGKHKYTTRKSAQKLAAENNARRLTEATAEAKPNKPPVDPYEFELTRWGRIKRLASTLHLVNLRPTRIFDMLEGGMGRFSGVWTRLFYDRANAAHQEELLAIENRHNALKEKMRGLAIKMEDVINKLDVDGIKVPIEQAMAIYAHAQNERGFEALLHGHKFSKAFLKGVIDKLPDKYKQLVDWMIQESDWNWPRIRQVIIETMNRDPGTEARYSPMVRVDHLGQPIAENLADQILQRKGIRRGRVERGFAEKRKKIAPSHQTRVDLHYVGVWLEQVRKQEHFVGHMGLVHELRSILHNADLRAEVERRFGRELLARVDKYLDRLANPTTYDAYTWLGKISRSARRNIAYAYLGVNLLTMMKQIPSIMLYTQDAGIAQMARSLGEVASNPQKFIQMVRQKDPQVRHASIERELEEMRRIAPEKSRRIINKVGVTGMLGIRFVDGLVRTIGWNAVYNRCDAQNMSEAECIREAQYATLRTQPAAAVKDMAEIYATNEVLNWFLMFTNQLNQIYNIVTYDTPAYWANKDYQKAATGILCVAISQAMIWSLATRKLPEDEDDWKDLLTETGLNLIPLVGRYASSGKQNFETDPPPFRAVKDWGRVLSATDKKKKALRAIESSAALAGIPIVSIRRGRKFLESGEPIELVGGKARR